MPALHMQKRAPCVKCNIESIQKATATSDDSVMAAEVHLSVW